MRGGSHDGTLLKYGYFLNIHRLPLTAYTPRVALFPPLRSR
jgi:hypothetical protein